MSTVALRTALIWHDEVMQDVVAQNPKKITLGARCVGRFPWIHALAIVSGNAAWIASIPSDGVTNISR